MQRKTINSTAPFTIMRDGLIFNKNREIIINFIKENPNATYKLIRTKTKLHPERFFSSLEDAYKEAGIKSPRTFKFKTKEFWIMFLIILLTVYGYIKTPVKDIRYLFNLTLPLVYFSYYGVKYIEEKFKVRRILLFIFIHHVVRTDFWGHCLSLIGHLSCVHQTSDRCEIG